MSPPGRTPLERGDATLERIRTDHRLHLLALAIAILAGLGLARVHWLGLVAGGGLVGLTSPTARRAPAYGIGFGLVVLVAFAAAHGGSLGLVAAMTPVVYVTVVAALGLPLLGSLARGVR